MRRIALTVLLFAMGAASAAALIAWRQPAAVSPDSATIVSTTRTAAEPPLIPPPPRVPEHAASLPPLTLIFEVVQSSANGTRRSTQSIVRTHDRIRISMDGGRSEWLFLQNLAFKDRTAGYLIDHDKRETRLYEETPLRSLVGIGGWLDVLTLRFDSTILRTLRATHDVREVGGVAFSRYVSPEPRREGVVEVWWNEALLLPLSVSQRSSGTEVISTLKELRKGAETAVLTEPHVRFPLYRVIDLADADEHH